MKTLTEEMQCRIRRWIERNARPLEWALYIGKNLKTAPKVPCWNHCLPIKTLTAALVMRWSQTTGTKTLR